MPDKFGWEWAGRIPPAVIAEAKAELSLELAVADELMGNGDYGPEVEKLAKEKMARAIRGERGAAYEHLVNTLMPMLGSGGQLRDTAEEVIKDMGRGKDELTLLKEPPVAHEPGPAGAG